MVFRKLIIKHVQIQWGLILAKTTAGTTCKQIATLTMDWQLQEKKNCLDHLRYTARASLIARCRSNTVGLIKIAKIGCITTQQAQSMTTSRRQSWDGGAISTTSGGESQSYLVLPFVWPMKSMFHLPTNLFRLRSISAPISFWHVISLSYSLWCGSSICWRLDMKSMQRYLTRGMWRCETSPSSSRTFLVTTSMEARSSCFKQIYGTSSRNMSKRQLCWQQEKPKIQKIKNNNKLINKWTSNKKGHGK